MNEKIELRKTLKAKRAQISLGRREEAKDRILTDLWPQLTPYKNVLSFASFDDELDLWPLNAKLEKEGRLLLLRMQDDELVPHRVKCITTELALSNLRILEPDPKKCERISLEEVSCILVPGLGFDKKHHRLGYGKGHYDRLLKEIGVVPSFGLCFREQYLAGELPSLAHDQRVSFLFLF